MAKTDVLKLKGKITKCLPGTKFKVKVNEPMEMEVVCSLSGKLRQNKIKIVENDEVEIEVSVYDFTNGRISWRY